jgi:DNA transformation protein and related proteins
MAVSEEFLQFVLDQLAGLKGASARRMFGGAGLYLRGIMFGLVADDKAYLRVDDSNRASFEDAGSEPFHPYGKSVTMPYYEVPIEVLEDAADFCAWAEKALAAAMRERRVPSRRKPRR